MPTTEEIQEAATQAGTEAGTSAGSWVTDGNTSDETKRAILQAFEDCEYDFPSPLSGEWAGESIPEIITNAGLDYDAMSTDEIHDYNDVDIFLDAYEAAYFTAYEAEVVRSILATLDDR